METAHRSVAALSNRLERLESGVRRWRLLAGAAIVAGVMPWVLGATRDATAPTDLRVHSLSLIGPDGAERGALKVEKGAPVLVLRDGARYAMLTLGDGNAGLASGGPGGVVFAGVAESGAYFNARGADLKTGVYAGVDTALTASFRGYGSDMKVASSLDVTADGTPTLKLEDPKTGSTSLPARRGAAGAQ